MLFPQIKSIVPGRRRPAETLGHDRRRSRLSSSLTAAISLGQATPCFFEPGEHLGPAVLGRLGLGVQQ